LVDRLYNAAYANGKGIVQQKSQLKQEAKDFVYTHLSTKTFPQLVNIEKAGRVLITQEFIQACGFELRTPTNETAFTYIKSIETPSKTIKNFQHT
jgi:hypothetical protein